MVDSVDLVVEELRKGSTIAQLQAPALGRTATAEMDQDDFWLPKPAETDTALDVLGEAIGQIVGQQTEGRSDRFDNGVLDALLSFRGPLRDVLQLELRTMDRGSTFLLNSAKLDMVKELRERMPTPRHFVVSGLFNKIEHQNRIFEIVFADGTRLRGTIDPVLLDPEVMRAFWGRKVTIEGEVHFTAQKVPRFLEARSIKEAGRGEGIFDRLPQAASQPDLFSEAQTRPNRLGKLMGAWPGDESIEELMEALEGQASA